MVADVASAVGRLDVLGVVVAATAVLLSFAGPARAQTEHAYAERLLPWLGFSAAVALLSVLSAEPPRIVVGIAEAMALCGLGAIVLDLALRVPDRLGSVRFSRLARGLTYGLGCVSAVLCVCSLVPAFDAFGRVWLFSARLADAPAYFAALCVLYALCVRLLRPRLGSGPEALAANAWGSLALAPAAGFAVLIALRDVRAARTFLQLAAAASALVLYFGHAFMVDPKRRLSASRVTRDSLAAAGTVLLMAALVAASGELVPRAPLSLALWTAGTLLVAVGVFFSLRALARQVLAPYRGRLLAALARVESELGGAPTIDELARIVLGALRDASGSRSAQPLLYGFDPVFEARLDAAGAAHIRNQAAHIELLARLQQSPGEILVRSSLEARISRSPTLRPLLEILQDYDVLCVVPLVAEGQLEGAFCVPRGSRRSQLTLEELSALRNHARWLTGMFTVFASRGRAEVRAHAALQANSNASKRAEELTDENARLRAALSLLHAGRLARSEAPPLIAYSPAMRALVAHVRTLTALESPVSFVAEPGLPVEPLARFLHAESRRPGEPFVIVDCAALRAEQAEVAVFGNAEGAGEDAGCLRAADAGSVLFLDLPALPRNVQRRLAQALVTGVARPASGGVAYRVFARVLASSRVALGELAEEGRFDAELAVTFESFVCRVPPLRECPEDFESQVLLAIDRACRRGAREPIGIEPDALGKLRGERWSENVAQLQIVMDRAVEHAKGVRITSLDLERAEALTAGVSPLEGHLDEVERKALLHAMSRALGNKSEAARLLGIPRTTLLDKLRRHKLEEAGRDAAAN